MLAAVDATDIGVIAMRVLHVGAAIIAGGGVAFQLFALQPTLRSLPDETRLDVREKIVARWAQVVWICVLLLLVTGLVNYLAFRIPEVRDKPYKGLYHGLIGVKMLLALAAFHGAGVLVLPRPRGDKYRAKAGGWLMYLACLFIAIIVLGAILRYADRLTG